jgi:hypothetical protein
MYRRFAARRSLPADFRTLGKIRQRTGCFSNQLNRTPRIIPLPFPFSRTSMSLSRIAGPARRFLRRQSPYVGIPKLYLEY